jgi:sugar phosphate isomerase/epimerase
MRQGISTHVFLQQRLTPVLLDHLATAGASVIEVFASRHHFDYTDRAAVAELAAWFRSNPVAASLHMPLFDEESEALWTRHTAPALNLISLNKSTRIETMDETKRALEAAEQIPLESCVIHLGLKDDQWDTRALDDSLTAVEHLKAFSGPLGVRLLLESLPNDVATPQHLVEIVSVGHFADVGFCLDLGHAHLGPSMPQTKDKAARSGIELSFAAFAPEAGRVGSVHLHDNHGVRDEHLWPGEGSIDWAEAVECMKSLPSQTAGILEIAHELGADPAATVERARAGWGSLQLPPA